MFINVELGQFEAVSSVESEIDFSIKPLINQAHQIEKVMYYQRACITNNYLFICFWNCYGYLKIILIDFDWFDSLKKHQLRSKSEE